MEEVNQIVETKKSKKEKRRELIQEKWKVKKQKKKELKKQLKSLKPPKTPEPQHEPEDISKDSSPITTNTYHNRKQLRTEQFLEAIKSNNLKVIIDCAWEDEHSDSNLSSLTQQIMHCYGFNRRYSHPVALYLTNLGARTTNNLEKIHFQQWTGVTTYSDDYLQHAEAFPEKEKLVYLTSDAEETLTSINHEDIYIIGGIVDRNRLKGITYQKAIQQGIRTAKLPIKEYFSLAATHILTINHVFEILLMCAQQQNDWTLTLGQVLPKRKEPKLKHHHNDSKGEDNGKEGEEVGGKEAVSGDGHEEENDEDPEQLLEDRKDKELTGQAEDSNNDDNDRNGENEEDKGGCEDEVNKTNDGKIGK